MNLLADGGGLYIGSGALILIIVVLVILLVLRR